MAMKLRNKWEIVWSWHTVLVFLNQLISDQSEKSHGFSKFQEYISWMYLINLDKF